MKIEVDEVKKETKKKEVKSKKKVAKKDAKKSDKKPKRIDPKTIPSVNIGLVGHVAHGKTTLVEALTGKLTLTHSEELKRGITIRLGYADTRIYKCKKCDKHTISEKCPYCFGGAELQRTVSFVDAPGHETLMATVLTGTSLMDGAIIIIAANEKCPQPQTREHLMALEVASIKNVIIVQNKIDLVDAKEAKKNHGQIKAFVKGTILEKAPIIPVSAQKGINIEFVLNAIQNIIPDHEAAGGEKKDVRMFIARSFDINKPGIPPKKIVGGVLGGSVISGRLKVGDDIEICPGARVKEKYKPLKTKIIGLQKAGADLEEAGPGGLLGVMTELDPSLTKSDALVGNVIGEPGKLPPVLDEIELDVNLMKRAVGSESMETIQPLKVGENLMINAGTGRSVGTVGSVKKHVKLQLKLPICVEKGERIVISRQIAGRWRLIGYGIIY
jgi:translation initiation factor 2 subunit 3